MSQEIGQEAPNQESDIFNMSDSEFMEQFGKMTEENFAQQKEESEDSSEEQEENEEGSQEEDSGTEKEESESEESEEDEQEETSEEGEEKPDEDESEEEEETSEEIDYKAEYERLLKPFKANGREMQVKNIDEAVRLMQMGANYNKKMSALKPNLGVLRMLEQNDLLDPDKIAFLIDISKKDKEAISKLLKDSGIDPLDIEDSADKDYKPKTAKVSDKQVELETIINDYKDDPNFIKFIQDTQSWDQTSVDFIADNPDLLHVMYGHISSGWYEATMAEVDRLKALGELTGLTMLQAYERVGTDLLQQGKLKGTTKPSPAKPIARKTTSPVSDATTSKKKRSAAPSPANSSSKKSGIDPDFNPLAMSDEEFEKQFGNQLQYLR